MNWNAFDEADFFSYRIYDSLNINGRQLTECRPFLKSLNYILFWLTCTNKVLLNSYRFTPLYNLYFITKKISFMFRRDINRFCLHNLFDIVLGNTSDFLKMIVLHSMGNSPSVGLSWNPWIIFCFYWPAQIKFYWIPTGSHHCTITDGVFHQVHTNYNIFDNSKHLVI
jgi:hypothetical protein